MMFDAFNWKEEPSPRELRLFIAVGALVVLFVAKFGWWDQAAQRAVLEKKLEGIQTHKSSLLEKHHGLTGKKSKKARPEDTFRGVVGGPNQITRHLSDPVLRLGLKLKTLDLLQSESYNEWFSQRIKMMVSGSYGSIKRYISTIIEHPVYFVVSRLRVERLETSQTQVVAHIEGKVYGKTSDDM